MNKIYRAIWNESTHTWVAASELAKSKTKANTVSGQTVKSSLLGKFGITAFKMGLLASVVNMALAIPNVYAAGRAGITGHSLVGSNTPNGGSTRASTNATIVTGDDNVCGADYIKYRSGLGSGTGLDPIDEYWRFAKNHKFVHGSKEYHPYDVTLEREDWQAREITTGNSGYQGARTGGDPNRIAIAHGINSFALGCGAYATGNHSLAFGTNATSTAGGAQAFGIAALAGGRASNAIGVVSQAIGVSAVALGSVATSDGVGSVALGLQAQATADGTVAVGVQSQAGLDSAVAIGNNNSATGRQSISIGSDNEVSGDQSIAIGNSATATTYNSDSTAENKSTNNTRIHGHHTLSLGNSNTSTTSDTSITAVNTAIFGNHNTINNAIDGGHIIGNRNTVGAAGTSNYATIIGNAASVSATNGLALGNQTSVSATDAIAVGSNAQATTAGAVALGAGSLANTANEVGFNPDNSVTDIDPSSLPAWRSATGAVAVGNVEGGITRQITDVAAGTADTDAANVAQLKGLASSVANSLNNVSISIDDTVTAISNVSTSIGAEVNELSGKIDAVSSTANPQLTDLSTTISAKEGVISGIITPLQQNVLLYQDGVYNAGRADGQTTNKIINVAASENLSADSTDMVNGGQLYTTNTNIGSLSSSFSSSFSDLSSSLSAAAGHDPTQISTNLNETKEKVSALQANALQWDEGAKGFSARHGSDGNQKITHVEAGDISSLASTDAVTGSQYYDLSTSIDTSVSTLSSSAQSKIDNSISELSHQMLRLVGDSFNAQRDKIDQKITGVANATLDSASSDAVTGAQLYSTNGSLNTLTTSTSTGLSDFAPQLTQYSENIRQSATNLVNGVGTGIGALQSDALQWDSTVKAYSANHGSDGKQRITNVADGHVESGSTDAINVGQIYSFSLSTASEINRLNGLSIEEINRLTTDIDSGLRTVNENITALKQNALQWNGKVYDASDVNGNKGRITNVAEGSTAQNSSDAVIGAQLYSTNSQITSLSTSVVDRISDFAQATTSELGDLSNILQNSSVAGLDNLSAETETRLNEINNQIPALQQNALQWDEGAKGFSARHGSDGNQKITNVAEGEVGKGSKDAVTGNQLYNTNTAISNLGDKVVADASSLTNSLSTISDESIANLTNSLQQTNTELTSLTENTALKLNSISSGIASLQNNALQWKSNPDGTGRYDASHGGSTQLITHVHAGAVAEDSTDAINGSQLFSLAGTFSTGLSSLSTSLEALTENQSGSLSSAIAGSLSAISDKLIAVEGNVSALQKNALQWKSTNGTEGVFDATRGGKSQQLTGIANGAISETSTDAINGMQMHSLSTATSSSLSILSSSLDSTNQNLTALQQNAMQWNNSLQAYDASRNINGEVVAQRITNVAAGQEATDAINFSQLSTLSSSIASDLDSLSTAVSTTMPTEISNITNSLSSGYSGLSESLSTTNDRLNNLVSDTNTRIESLSTGYVEMHNNVAKLQEDSQNSLRWNSEYNGGEGAFDASKPGSLTRASEPGKIINVADGDISEHSHDAVTGGQLFTVKSDLASLSTATSSSLSSINNMLQTGGISSSISSLQVNISSLQENALQWDNSLHAYDARHKIDGVAKAQRITNVAAGQETTDAVNFGQLSSVQNDLANLSTRVDNLPTGGGISQDAFAISNQISSQDYLTSLSTALGNQIASITSGLGASYNPSTGNVGLRGYEIIKPDGSKETVTNVPDALQKIQDYGSTEYVKINSKKDAIAAGANSIAVGGAANAIESSAIAIGNSAGAMKSESVALGDSAKANAIQGIALGSGAQVGVAGGVALGANSVVANRPEGEIYIPGTATEEQKDVILATRSGAGAVSVGNEEKEIYRQITGVAAGFDDSDAVNVAQLKAVDNQIGKVNEYVNQLNDNIHHVERRAYSGTAMAMALSGAYLPSLDSGGQTVGLGVGAYRSYGAVGVNYKAASKNGKVTWGAGVSTTGKEVAVNSALGLKW
ncbi:ESPR-type extended signal peptide-containing protein [Snodgrassella gandavensis]|uniref:ESPR-type extended signal peptide-containing protein n=1 Tax=Snodgrassella gandavensis TaxID=2946698 RepID=UPI001EF71512|nr:ESPR-type extended signal peptide-containing protein [Snodgrassella gandavensis]